MDLKSNQIGIFHPCKLGLRDYTLLGPMEEVILTPDIAKKMSCDTQHSLIIMIDLSCDGGNMDPRADGGAPGGRYWQKGTWRPLSGATKISLRIVFSHKT